MTRVTCPHCESDFNLPASIYRHDDPIYTRSEDDLLYDIEPPRRPARPASAPQFSEEVLVMARNLGVALPGIDAEDA